MKKFAVLLMILGMIFAAGNVFAAAIGGRVIYNSMMDDYSDAEFENNISGGIFFDVGYLGFRSLKFRPGLDYVDLERDDTKWATVYGIHLDWYWFFLKSNRKFAPYLGFGPALNYYSFEDDQSDDNDSDAGIEGFGGCEFSLGGSLALIAEARLVIHDIADTGWRIFKPSIGLIYYF